jgi:RNA recognition motif-containing protein
MANKLFVGSLAWATNDDSLKTFFEQAGAVESASVFGFVEMTSDDEAKAAIDQLNGKELDGRPVVVSMARPREERPRPAYNN